MKRLTGLYSLILAFILSSCAPKHYIDQATLLQLVGNDAFTFMAQRAHPMDYAAVNRATSSISGAIPTRVLDLDYGYTLELGKNTLKMHLPYFGRAYTTTYGAVDNGFKLESEDFTLYKTETKKSYIYNIIVKDKPNIQRIILEIFPSGRAMLSIQSTDRQPISYDGYVMKPESEELSK